MHSFNELVAAFGAWFNTQHFPSTPVKLYEPGEYFLSQGGKRLRPVMCLAGNELFTDIVPEAYEAATAIELFHNFTLIHDDIMDESPLRRGMQTVHAKYGSHTAVLTGDVMMIRAYERLAGVNAKHLPRMLALFNKTAREVCEGQQLDMDFEKRMDVVMDEYLEMITLKTSVLLAASLEMGAILGGAGEGNCRQLYDFGKNLGIAFQLQDDYLDAFGDPDKFGKEVGGDIRKNKKTFLLLRTLEKATEPQRKELLRLMEENPEDKVPRVLTLFKECKVDEWAKELKNEYYDRAMRHLEAVAVLAARKSTLKEVAAFMIQREV